MFQCVYISTMAAEIDAGRIGDIRSESRRNNAICTITGLLLHRGRRFMQVMEGKRDDVLATVARMVAQVDRLTADANPNLRAQFLGYPGMAAG